MQWGLPLLSALPCWFEPAVRNGPAKRWLNQIGAKKKARKQARMLSCLIYFFGPFSIYYILHDYVIPQAMPHAIPQTHSSFYPHNGWDKNRKRKVPCINSVRFTALIKHSQFREYFFFLNHRKIFHQKLELSAISLSLFTCSSFCIDFISRKLR